MRNTSFIEFYEVVAQCNWSLTDDVFFQDEIGQEPIILSPVPQPAVSYKDVENNGGRGRNFH